MEHPIQKLGVGRGKSSREAGRLGFRGFGEPPQPCQVARKRAPAPKLAACQHRMNYPRKSLAARAKQGNYSAGRGHGGSRDTEILSKSDWDGTAGGAGGQQLDTSRFGSSWGGLPGAVVSSPHLPRRVRGQGDPRGKPTLVLG